MGLPLYLDDCICSKRLAELLRADGHSVVVPEEVGLSGKKDFLHFEFACMRRLVVVTKNPADFIELHARTPEHPAVFAIYQDNDPERDMNYLEIVAAIRSLEEAFAQAGSIHNQVHNLNHWRPPAANLSASSQEVPPQPPPKTRRRKLK